MRYLLFVVFISGMSSLGIEITASRLMAPFFGTSLFIWTNIIGVVLISLSLGYYIGGRIADKKPNEKTFYTIIFLSGLIVATIPFTSGPIQNLSLIAINDVSISLFYSSLLATLILFAIPTILLGMVSPFAIRLSTKNIENAGIVSGKIFALSTVGSILGVFLPTLLTIPTIGTKRTIIVFGFLLAISAALGLGRKKFVVISLLVLFFLFATSSIKLTKGVIYEEESLYNYIQVEEINGVRYLKLNEGHAIHSIYDPNSTKVGSYFEMMNIFPLLKTDSKNVLNIGLAAGTFSKQYNKYFPDIEFDGVEIDDKIIEVGQRFFDMNDPNLNVYNMDGRVFLKTTDKEYDIILIDAYKQPYIPFHLTTKEFFYEVKNNMKEDGIVAINVGSTKEDSDLLLLLENTLGSVFQNVYIIKVNNSFNFILFASDKEYDFDISTKGDLESVVEYAKNNYKKIEFNKNIGILTDDMAPIELLTDKMIFEYIVE